MKNKIFKLLIVGLLCWSQTAYAQNHRIVANPMNLVYRFQPQDNDPARREAADPVCEYFKGKYYLFASKSGGYWSSPDLAEWTYIPCTSIETIENYAPTILVIKDTLYFMASWRPVKIYKTPNPEKDNWELINTQFDFPATGTQDPAFFRDDDGRVYMYWGCSDKDPIFGVEVDPDDGFKVIGKAVSLIEHRSKIYGWENPGDNNERNKDGWNEGPCMIKHEGKYYLQYAAPGTEFRTYADGVYTGDHPLGPFTYMPYSPFSFKPGGFAGGAGHGHTFSDKYGNYWHVASMKISQRHMFERRLGLFPLYITAKGALGQHSVWMDYPFIIPSEKTDFETNDGFTGWNMLSYRKPVASSSFLEGYKPDLAVDERIETWWAAQTGNPGEWLQVDLKKNMEIRAIQVNFADHDFTLRAPHPLFYYQYVIEASTNGENWSTIVDRSANSKDAVHDLTVLNQPVHARYLRITNSREVPGKFSLYGFRIFGSGKGKAPGEVSGIRVQRNPDDPRRFFLSWNKQEDADGYIVHARREGGFPPQSVMVYDNEYEGGFFNRDSEYDFTVEAFNENGRSVPSPVLMAAITSIGKDSFSMVKKYDSYKGLVMAGYQGWFSCPGDGSDRGWYRFREAEMLYLAMFDEIDEGTAIFKCATEVPAGESYFLPLDADLGNDYYLFLAGQAAKMLRKEIPFTNHIPERE
ncbi:MAG: family 43 glycosylhydrolase [Tannerellaceae bacterium]|jgi:hypothetical protein|nr:family 43 glycosylhydrolase [Tannerellaceae bacterium]